MPRYARLESGESNKAEIINLFHASKSQQPSQGSGAGDKGLGQDWIGLYSGLAIEGNGLITIVGVTYVLCGRLWDR